MGKERLESTIVQRQCASRCREELKIIAVVSNLASFWPWIFNDEVPTHQGIVLSIHGYDDIKSLRNDATELASSLRRRIGEENWEK